MAIEIQHPDGRVELSDNLQIERSPLYNHDLAPVRVAQRNWSTYNFAALDQSVEDATAYGQTVSIVVIHAPSWAEGPNRDPNALPRARATGGVRRADDATVPVGDDAQLGRRARHRGQPATRINQRSLP